MAVAHSRVVSSLEAMSACLSSSGKDRRAGQQGLRQPTLHSASVLLAASLIDPPREVQRVVNLWRRTVRDDGLAPRNYSRHDSR